MPSSSTVSLNTGTIVPNTTAIQDGIVATPASSYAVANQNTPLRLIGTASVTAPRSLVKIQLMATLSDNSMITFTVQYNPETLEIQRGTRFGQYGGVQFQPRMFYSGVEVNKMEIRTIVIDRKNGLIPILQNLYQFSNPDPTVSGSFATPPLSKLNYGQTGIFTGYVERPRLEIQEWSNGLKPIRGYLTFTFNVIQHAVNGGGTIL
jgi:hypothetical protein